MRSVGVAWITAEAFAPFGDLLEAPDTPPRQDRAGRIENLRAGVGANLALVIGEPFPGLMPLRRMERHPASNQAFLPLKVEAYLVVVAPDRGGAPDEAGIRAFRVPGHVGLNYRAGAWHAHMMTVGSPGTFAMLVHEDGSERDCEFAAIAPTSLALAPEG